MNFEVAVTAVVAFSVAAGAVGFLSRALRLRKKFDLPNERSAHKIPTPRGGGMGLAAGVIAGLAVAAFVLDLPVPQWVVLAGAGALAAIGARDDWAEPLSVRIRLVAQSAIAAGVLAVTGPLERLPLPSPLDVELGVWGYALSGVWIVGVTNIYNFLDGIDGYAGFQALVAAAGLVLFAFDPAFVTVGAALGGAALGFLLYNWRPASIFMGDSGSTSIGFLLATMPFQAPAAARPEATFVMALALWFFLADGAYTVVARALKGEKFWMAHNVHLYQRLVRTGIDHDGVVLRIGAGAFALVLGVYVYARREGTALSWRPLALATFAFAALWLWTRVRESRVQASAPVSGSASV